MKVLLPTDEYEKLNKKDLSLSVEKIGEDEIKKLPKEGQPELVHPQSLVAVHASPEYGIWTKYEFTKKLSPEERDRYQWFVAGFLYYYDTEVRKNSVDHQIFFKWESHQVLIYMSPAPLIAYPKNIFTPANTVTTDPPKPPQPPPPPRNP